MNSLKRAAISAVVVMVAGCSLWSEPAEVARTTCGEWLSLSAVSQTDLATTMIDSEDVLESVRKAQRREPTTAKASLIADVVASITKNCEFPGQTELLVAALTMELYGGGREYDGKPGAPGP